MDEPNSDEIAPGRRRVLPGLVRCFAIGAAAVLLWMMGTDPTVERTRPYSAVELLARFIPGDVDGAGIFRVDAFRRTALYQNLKGDLEGALWTGRVEAAARDAGFSFEELHAFAFSWKWDAEQGGLPLAALSGRFDGAAMLSGIETLLGVDAEQGDLDGVPFVGSVKDQVVMVAPEPGVLLMGERSRVRDAMKLAGGEGVSFWAAEGAKRLAQRVDVDAVLWAVGAIPDGIELPAFPGSDPAVLQRIGRFAFALTQEGGGIQLRLGLETGGDANAQQIAEGIRFALNILSKLVEGGEKKASLGVLFERLHVTHSGSSVILALSIEGALMESLRETLRSNAED